jgi:hypothetical protein
VGAVDGIVWHSRQTELATTARPSPLIASASDVADLVVFNDRVPSGRRTWPLHAPGIDALYVGPGRLRVDEIAQELGATIMPAS